jgi:hypothetical protein
MSESGGDGMNEHQALDGTGGRPGNTAYAPFAELLCADADLLRLEFEAIIAANFSPPGSGQRLRLPPRRDPIRATGELRPAELRRPVVAVAGSPSPHARIPEARERSPPPEAVRPDAPPG